MLNKFLDSVFNKLSKKENDSLNFFLLQYVDKKLSNDDVMDIIKKITSYFSIISINKKFNTIIDLLIENQGFQNELNNKIKIIENNLNIETIKESDLSKELVSLLEKNKSEFNIKYSYYVQNKFNIFTNDLKELSKLNHLYDDFSKYDSQNKIFYTLTNNPTKNNFTKFENDILQITSNNNKTKFSINDEYVNKYSKKIPKIKNNFELKDYEENSTKYNKSFLFKYLINIIDNKFTKNDLNILLNKFQKYENIAIETQSINNENIKLYNFDKDYINKHFNSYINKITYMIELEEEIEYKIDLSNKHLHNINKIELIDKEIALINKFVNTYEDDLKLDLNNIITKIISKVESYDLLIKNYFPNEKTFKENITIKNNIISKYDDSNIKKQINEIKVVENNNKKEEIENKKEFVSFYA